MKTKKKRKTIAIIIYNEERQTTWNLFSSQIQINIFYATFTVFFLQRSTYR